MYTRSTQQSTNQQSSGISRQGATSSSSYTQSTSQPQTLTRPIAGTGTAFSSSILGGADLQTEHDIFLKYATSEDTVVVSGSSDYGIISGLRDAILKLKTDFFSRTGSITIKTEERADLDRRFLLFEHELDGLLRRRI